MQGCIYNYALVSSEPEVLYACSADGKVCQLEDNESTGTHITATFDSDTVLTQLCLPPGALAQRSLQPYEPQRHRHEQS